MKKIFKKVREKKGFSFLEVMGVLVILAIFTIAIVDNIRYQNEETSKILVAQHFDKVISAATKFFEEERCLKGIKDGIDSGMITKTGNTLITSTAVVDGVTGICNNLNLNNFEINKANIPDMEFVSEYNSLGQKYYGYIRATDNNKPLLFIYSRDRNNNDYPKKRIKTLTPITANFIGTYAGYVPETNPVTGTVETIAIGGGKSWEYDLNLAGITGIKPGNLVGVKVLGERSVFIDIKDDHLLHREQDPEDPVDYKAMGYNEMHWELDMTENDIQNVKSVHFSDADIDCSDTAAYSDGTTYHKTIGSEKNLYVCFDGKSHQINTSMNSMQIKDIVLTEANATSSADYITPSVCTLDNGSTVEATAFISSTVMSSGEGTSATAAGDSIIAVKTWIDRVGDKWKPRMEINTITGKKIQPVGPHSRVLVMAICPRTNI